MKEKTKKCLIVGALAITTVGCGILIYKNHSLTAQKLASCSHIKELEQAYMELEKRYVKAVNLNCEKDAFMKAYFSDELRHGSPRAGRQMAYLKHVVA